MTDITEKQDGGVIKEIIREGTGEETPKNSWTVFVHYEGKLEDGTIFDSSRERGEKFSFQVGEGKVIKAWDLCLPTMKKGEVCKITCKPEYAYGEAGSPPKIPPNSTLIFEIELFEWKWEDLSDGNGDIQRWIITKGELYSTPQDFAHVEAHVSGSVNGKVFDERDVEFVIGEGCEHDIVPGLETAITKMKAGEKSRIKLSPRVAYGAEGNANVPPNSEVFYDVYLKKFDKAKESWELDITEKLPEAEKAKEKGTYFFKKDKLSTAKKYYKRVISFLESEDRLEGDEKQKRDTLLVAGHLNMALIELKKNDTRKIVEHCTKALEVDPNNEKALFRRGTARVQVKDFEAAREDFETLVRVNPNNTAAQKSLTFCKDKLREQLVKEKQMFQRIFSKMAQTSSNDAQDGKMPEIGDFTMDNSENKPASQVNAVSFDIGTTWDGDPIAASVPDGIFPRVSILREENGFIPIEIEAPFYNDPLPPGVKAGEAYFKLWDYEVVEIFFLGANNLYLETEFSPHGAHLILLLNGEKKAIKHSLPITFTAKIEGKRWKGKALIPLSYFPPSLPFKMNAYAIHGTGEQRTYQALYPVPKGQFDSPNFHRLEYFRDVNLQPLFTSSIDHLSEVWEQALAEQSA